MDDVFEYDPRKSKLNEDRHGIGFEMAQRLWETSHVILPAKHVRGENRHLLIGKLRGRIHVAIFTYRGQAIRLISCHRADKRWERIYEFYVRQEETH